MKLNERFNKERARRLQIKGIKENSLIEYCPKCNFQLHPEVKSLKFCPICKTPLVALTLTKEMANLINGE
jgi:ssDNA-binding Zn-finger/Zn-ribbon topoisomerase 1